jgi:pyruvate/2-oxoglutarate dehydrogenase complex dihydrolipoamide acyltransferase (E2) component
MCMDIIIGPDKLGDEAEVELTRWIVDDGEIVTAGDPVAEVETAKALLEVLAPQSGELIQMTDVGSILEAGAVIGKVEPVA